MTVSDEVRARAHPRYPVYVPTRSRWQTPYTAKVLIRDEVPFHAVVVPSEVEQYAAVLGEERLLVLPSDDYVLIDARNWIKEHSIAAGYARHWQLDDNLKKFSRMWKQRRLPCASSLALRTCEDFSDRYTNVAVSGLNYHFFVVGQRRPFTVNTHVYSCTLVNNAIPHRWRLVYNDDTDLCLQVLADGWCTVLLNVYSVRKMQTMTVRGGNTDSLYQGDGRLRMARQLERVWPGVVTVDRRYGRPQHVVNWKKFRTPLIRRPDVGPPPDYPMTVREVKPIKSESLRKALGK